MHTKSERRNARERLVLLLYSEGPLLSAQATFRSRGSTYKSSPPLHQDIHQPLQRNTGDSRGSQKGLGSQWQQSCCSASPEAPPTRERGLETQIQQCLGNEWSRAAHTHQLELQLSPKVQSTAAQSPCPSPQPEPTEW